MFHAFKSATLNENRRYDFHNISGIKSRKSYIEGEENVKDCDESDTNTSRIINDRNK